MLHHFYRISALTLLVVGVTACSSPKTIYPSVPVEPIAKEEKNTETLPSGRNDGPVQTKKKKVKTKKLAVDDSKPATYSAYKQWRKTNDPGGQVYAEFKEWEAAYKQWQKQQAQSLNQ